MNIQRTQSLSFIPVRESLPSEDRRSFLAANFKSTSLSDLSFKSGTQVSSHNERVDVFACYADQKFRKEIEENSNLKIVMSNNDASKVGAILGKDIEAEKNRFLNVGLGIPAVANFSRKGGGQIQADEIVDKFPRSVVNIGTSLAQEPAFFGRGKHFMRGLILSSETVFDSGLVASAYAIGAHISEGKRDDAVINLFSERWQTRSEASQKISAMPKTAKLQKLVEFARNSRH